MITARKNKLIGKLFSLYHNKLLKKHFFAVHLSGIENFHEINSSYPVILYANHSNWWDGFIAYFLTNRILKTDDYLMMDIEQMKKYSFFKYIGVFSVNRTKARDAMESINYAAKLLSGTKKYLWMFPQGEMQPQEKLPVVFYSGITKITQKLPAVNLIPVSIRYEFLMEQRPEVFIQIGKPDVITNPPAKELLIHLQDKLNSGCELLKEKVINNNTADFKTVFRGKNSRNKTFDKFTSS